MKIWINVICYGKTMKSIAEDLNVSEDKAKEIYDCVLTNIPGLKRFMDESQQMAHDLGYVEDKWGRRRYIPDMQLEPYEIKSEGTKNFDPFFDSEELGVVDDCERLRRQYLKEITEAKYRQQKEKIKEKAKSDGFKIKENTRLIEDASRQCVNARVQGSASTQSKIAMRLIGTNPELKKYMFKMELLVHDEIIGECPYILAKKCSPIFRQCMLDSGKDLRSGCAVDVECSSMWYGESYELDELTVEKLNEIKQIVYK